MPTFYETTDVEIHIGVEEFIAGCSKEEQAELKKSLQDELFLSNGTYTNKVFADFLNYIWKDGYDKLSITQIDDLRNYYEKVRRQIHE